MENFRDEFRSGRLIRIVFTKVENKLESTILKRSTSGPEDNRLPHEYVIFGRCAAYTCRWIFLEYCHAPQHFVKMTTKANYLFILLSKELTFLEEMQPPLLHLPASAPLRCRKKENQNHDILQENQRNVLQDFIYEDIALFVSCD